MEKKAQIDFKNEMNRMADKSAPFLFIIDYAMDSFVILPLQECGPEGVFFDIEDRTNYSHSSVNQLIGLKINPVPYPEYLSAFRLVQEEIHKGNSYLVNLTFPTPVESNLDLLEIFNHSVAPYKLIYKDQFVVFSPECFVKISKGKIYTFPMKGTIDASLENAETILLDNEKETAEHATIVDLLRNDLSQVAGNVKVDKYRYIEKIITSGKSLLQMSSVISGDLLPEYQWKPGDLLIKLLPAGSVTGAPKDSTLKIIADAEKHERGFYTGVFGICDGENLSSGVMIRFIENQDGHLVYKSGGGITAKSKPDEEYQELIDKIYVPLN